MARHDDHMELKTENKIELATDIAYEYSRGRKSWQHPGSGVAWGRGGGRAATLGIKFLHSTKITSEKSLCNNKSYKSGNNINDKWVDISLSEFFIFEFFIAIIDYWDENMTDMSKDFFCSARLFLGKGKVWSANSSFAPGASNSRCASASRIFINTY